MHLNFYAETASWIKRKKYIFLNCALVKKYSKLIFLYIFHCFLKKKNKMESIRNNTSNVFINLIKSKITFNIYSFSKNTIFDVLFKRICLDPYTLAVLIFIIFKLSLEVKE